MRISTTIRMGAAHYDVVSKVSGPDAPLMTAEVDLAKIIWGLPRPQRNEQLSQCAAQLCAIHDVSSRTRATPGEKRDARKRWTKRRAPTAAKHSPAATLGAM